MCLLFLVADPSHVLGRKGRGTHLVCELDPRKVQRRVIGLEGAYEVEIVMIRLYPLCFWNF